VRRPEGSPRAYTGESAREAFAELYEQHFPRVFRYITYRVSSIQLAEDLTSEVFLKALKGFSGYRSERGLFSTWIMSIARHTVIDHHRVSAKKEVVPLEKAVETPSEGVTEEEVVKKEEFRRLQICLAGLAQQEQEIISLKFGAELTNRQIAGMLNISESNVGTILYRAVRKLRDCFRERQNG
jgi:RNA polymerase sigma-70 factor (ECF subfamily)